MKVRCEEWMTAFIECINIYNGKTKMFSGIPVD